MHYACVTKICVSSNEDVLYSSVLLHPVLSLNELDFSPEAVSDTLSVSTLTRISLQGSSVLKAVTEERTIEQIAVQVINETNFTTG